MRNRRPHRSWATAGEFVLILGLALGWLAGPGQASPAASGPQPKPDPVEALGVTEGGPVETGFVFFDGRYLDAPYRVSRRGIQVLVNDVVIYEWQRWPLPDLTVHEDPGPPQGLTENSTLEDLRNRAEPGNNIVARKLRWLRKQYPEEVVLDKIADYFRQMPFVANAEYPKRGLLRLTLKNGGVRNVFISCPRSDSAYSETFTNEKLVERLEEVRRRHEKYLKQGDALLLYSNGQSQRMMREKAASDLPLMVEILRSGRPLAEKIRWLERMEIIPPASVVDRAELFHAIVTGFQASGQLEQRIQALVKASGLTPRTYADIPAEAPMERDARLQKEQEAKESRNQE